MEVVGRENGASDPSQIGNNIVVVRKTNNERQKVDSGIDLSMSSIGNRNSLELDLLDLDSVLQGDEQSWLYGVEGVKGAPVGDDDLLSWLNAADYLEPAKRRSLAQKLEVIARKTPPQQPPTATMSPPLTGISEEREPKDRKDSTSSAESYYDAQDRLALDSFAIPGDETIPSTSTPLRKVVASVRPVQRDIHSAPERPVTMLLSEHQDKMTAAAGKTKPPGASSSSSSRKTSNGARRVVIMTPPQEPEVSTPDFVSTEERVNRLLLLEENPTMDDQHLESLGVDEAADGGNRIPGVSHSYSAEDHRIPLSALNSQHERPDLHDIEQLARMQEQDLRRGLEAMRLARERRISANSDGPHSPHSQQPPSAHYDTTGVHRQQSIPPASAANQRYATYSRSQSSANGGKRPANERPRGLSSTLGHHRRSNTEGVDLKSSSALQAAVQQYRSGGGQSAMNSGAAGQSALSSGSVGQSASGKRLQAGGFGGGRPRRLGGGDALKKQSALQKSLPNLTQSRSGELSTVQQGVALGTADLAVATGGQSISAKGSASDIPDTLSPSTSSQQVAASSSKLRQPTPRRLGAKTGIPVPATSGVRTGIPMPTRGKSPSERFGRHAVVRLPAADAAHSAVAAVAVGSAAPLSIVAGRADADDAGLARRQSASPQGLPPPPECMETSWKDECF